MYLQKGGKNLASNVDKHKSRNSNFFSKKYQKYGELMSNEVRTSYELATY